MQHQPLLKVKVTITHTYCNLYTLASRENMHAMNDSHFESQYCGGSCTPQAFLHLDLGKHDIVRNKRHYALHSAQVICIFIPPPP